MDNVNAQTTTHLCDSQVVIGECALFFHSRITQDIIPAGMQVKEDISWETVTRRKAGGRYSASTV